MPVNPWRCAPVLVLLFAAACQPETAELAETPSADPGVALQTLQSRYSYAIGIQIAQNMHSQGVEVDLDALTLAMRDVFAEEEPRLAEAERREALQGLSEMQRDKEGEQLAAAHESGTQFRTDNKAKDGVIETASGLQYREVAAGTGEPPGACDLVTVHYVGSLIDGTEFDSSVGRGQPATFGLGDVIPGWTEGLQLMRQGGKAQLVIPPELAYGDRSNPRIPGGSTLVFDVELLEFQSQPCE